MLDAEYLIDTALHTRFFVQHEGEAPPALQARWIKGLGNLVLVLGPNASGKSFLRRIIGAICHRPEKFDNKHPKTEYIHLSMEGRNDSFGGLRSFVYGSEQDESTGQCSVGTVMMAISTAQKRESDHVIFWDEPDFGLSDEYAAGLGQTIVGFANALPEHTRAAFVTTHRRCLVRELLKAEPHLLLFGDMPPVKDWLRRRVIPIDPKKLQEESRERWLQIAKLLKD